MCMGTGVSPGYRMGAKTLGGRAGLVSQNAENAPHSKHALTENPSDCATSFSWCGNTRSMPPACTSTVSPRNRRAIALHSMCHPGRPFPIAVSQNTSPSSGLYAWRFGNTHKRRIDHARKGGVGMEAGGREPKKKDARLHRASIATPHESFLAVHAFRRAEKLLFCLAEMTDLESLNKSWWS